MSIPMNSRSRSHSTSSGKSVIMPSPMSVRSIEGLKTGSGLQPCAATPTFVLFAQGTSILCLLYDSLALERRFEGHVEDITLIVADNTSEDGVGRIVSVDASKRAIVWDSHTGDELARYDAFAEIKVAAWMKNGNLAFGDSMGNVILFDPLTSESISARTIYDPLCSIAPAADCKTFALGYTNGSVLIAALSPSFIILHTLTTTSLQPSPIATLAWHASSSRQKSDMLATQTRDGDLRVWSVPKSLDAEEGARVVRILKKPDSNRKGDNWMGWSRNGRIVQYSEGETTIWDVRTKKVTWERVGTLDNVCGITVFGPKGILFTLGKDDTVQQFALYPPTLLANVQHTPTVPPPSPPVSIEEKKVVEEEQYEEVFRRPFSTEEDAYLVATMSPLGRIAHELEQLEKMEGEAGLGITNVANVAPRPRTGSVSSRSSDGSIGKGHQHTLSTTSSKGTQRSSGDQSEFSQATSISTSRKDSFGSTGAPMPSPSRLPHPLRQEIHQSPDEARTATPRRDTDLFAGLRAKLASVTYQSPRIGSPRSNMSEDDHRKEMLFSIFGWKGDIEHLIQDQLDSVDARSMSAVILRMWLGDLNQNSLSVLLGADFSVPGDWVFLALSAMVALFADVIMYRRAKILGSCWAHVVRAFVMRLLQKGELHTAALCLLALGDKNDAVEVYVSHKKYMEAVLLASLLWKKDWKKQSQLVRKWGEHCAENSEGALAARCFACAGTEAPPTERPAPPARTHSRSRSETESIQNFVRGLPISAPTNPRATLRMTPKNSPLKLITTFPSTSADPAPRSSTTSPVEGGKMASINRFFGWAGGKNGAETPVSAVATPIAMSAISPGADIAPWNARRDPFASTSAKTAISPWAKLAPVTEMSPDEKTPKQLRPSTEKLAPPLPEEKEMTISSPIEPRNSSGFSGGLGPVTLGDYSSRSDNNTPTIASSAASPVVTLGQISAQTPVSRRASPSMAPAPMPSLSPKPPTPPMNRAPTNPLPAPPPEAFNSNEGRLNGSSQRKPAGLQIQWPPMDDVIRHATPPMPSTKHRRTGSRTTPALPPFAGKSVSRPQPQTDDFDGLLNVLDTVNQQRLDPQRAAPLGTVRRRAESPDVRGRGPARHGSRERSRNGRGRHEGREKVNHQRSPSSPLPMSPQARLYREDVEEEDLHEEEFKDERYYTTNQRSTSRAVSRDARRDASASRPRTRSRDTRRQESNMARSPSTSAIMLPQAHLYHDEVAVVDDFEDERYYKTATLKESSGRGRSHSRNPGASALRSPSSPLPMSPGAQLYAQMADEAEAEERLARRNIRRTLREESRNRGTGGLRRSRSERTLRQWSNELERVGTMTRRPSISGLPSRTMSIRGAGLPATPRAWKNELGSSRAGSRANSPNPGARGRSPALTGTASSTPRIGTPGIGTPGVGRTMSPGPLSGGRTITLETARANSPAPRARTPGSGRTHSPAPVSGGSNHSRGPSDSGVKPSLGLPTKPGILRMQNYYYPGSDQPVADYEQISSPRGPIPEVPPLPNPSHIRKASGSQTAEFKPLIRHLRPQPPPNSPPPLPKDLPVHPALQMHLDISPGGRKDPSARGYSSRRAWREDMSPIHSYEEEANIVVGIEGEALQWDSSNNLHSHHEHQHSHSRSRSDSHSQRPMPVSTPEMKQLRGHGASPSMGSIRSVGSAGSSSDRVTASSVSEAIGSLNQI